ncbi:hypothetical protein E2C01_067602 [Portunus trituberculatus]|uniref:Uncharacterized protein n=1 Tax=Portunus trituberculatus TaxID=210409 RepID=A0A5B7HU33_PORTR|nr:hypothetical protein [Portunus trituberculatus]
MQLAYYYWHPPLHSSSSSSSSSSSLSPILLCPPTSPKPKANNRCRGEANQEHASKYTRVYIHVWITST